MAEGNVVGSAEFELRASRAKIQGDMEAARREVEEASKRTEASLAGIVGTGTAQGARKGADALKEAGVAGTQAGDAIRASMKKAGEEVASSISSGAQKAKAELDALARKAREVQAIKPPSVSAPTEATHNLVTNPLNGVQSWVPKEMAANSAARDAKIDGGVTRAKAEIEALNKAASDIKPSAEMGAEGLGKVNAKALMTGAAIGALIGGAVLVTKALWDMGRAAMQSAGEIADTAKRIGISTDALQEWRYVAVKTGQDAKAADQAIGAFSERLALAGARLSKEAVKDFAALGFSPEQLKSFKSTEEALDTVIDRISDLKSESDRAAIAERLGLGPLGVAIRSSADEVAKLRDEAQRLGVVMDADLVKRGADAQQQFETLSRVIDVQLKSAFLDLAPAIVKAIELVAELARDLNDALDQWRRLDEKTGRGLRTERAKLVAERDAIADRFGTKPLNGQVVVARRIAGEEYTNVPANAAVAAGARPFGFGSVPQLPSASNENWGLFERRSRTAYTDAGEQFDAAQRRIAAIDAELSSRVASTPQRADRSGGNTLTLPPGRTRAPKADHSADREARRAERVEQEIYRLRQRALGIYDREMATVQQRYDIEQAQVKLEREAEAKELESRLVRNDINKAEYGQLKLIQDQTARLEDRVAADLLSRDLADERLAKERALSDLTADLLSLQADAARTAKERREIELKLLAMAQQRARDDLERELARTPGLTEGDKQARRDALNQVQAAQTDATNRRNMTPLEAWRDQSLKTAAEVREAYEGVAARGLDALNDGIVDAIMNARDLGDVFSQVAKGILADLLAISVRQSITEPLANLLFGQGGGGGGDAKAAARAAKGLTGGGGDGGGLVSGLFGGGKVQSGANWLSKAIGGLGGFFGGGRAFGGPVHEGMAYRVGEHGPETLLMPRNGFVVPDGAFGSDRDGPSMGGGAGRAGASVVQNFNVRDYDSFRRSQRQIARDTKRSLDR